MKRKFEIGSRVRGNGTKGSFSAERTGTVLGYYLGTHEYLVRFDDDRDEYGPGGQKKTIVCSST